MLRMKKGFTLIELLVVIGILAVLMAGVVALIDPVEKNRQAMDSRSQAIVAQLATAEESYAAQHNGEYAADAAELVALGELKIAPVQPSTAYSTTWVTTANPCTAAGHTCTRIIVCNTLTSKKYTGGAVSYPVWKYDTNTGVSCPATACTAAGTCMP